MRTRGRTGVFADDIPAQIIADGVALVNGGHSWAEAAKRVGVCMDSLRKRARRDGLTFRRGKRSFNKGVRLNLPSDPIDLSYLAGILDGEGNITIAKAPRNVVRVSIANTSVMLMSWLQSIGGGVCPLKKRKGQKSKTRCYAWQLYSRLDTRAFLVAVLPYMHIKKARAEQAVNLISFWVHDQEEALVA